ncbi:hypothetical protein OESDEN_02732 [Oesophagostomum dentatum]|uniref:Peptidase family A16 n=1 Tax=Oesophagostomum dentatum TaxID=61180 RepID=A0A0B1TIB5_OESDE|nr:hypothetical protein OESDEN_02732 [Oesophagostomum dentatum]
MMDLNKYLEQECNSLDLITMQWLNTIDFRKEELVQQKELISSSAASNTNSQLANSVGWSSNNSTNERNIHVRRPLLEVPSFSGNFREFNTFWSVFDSLIHADRDLTEVEKFLFLKQALKGKAAAAIRSLPFVGDKYHVAVDILKKHFDKSASMADIIIDEIERLPRAREDPRSCRETFEAIYSRISHLEQTGTEMNVDRIWRRIILSKFPEFVCRSVIQKENEARIPFDVSDIIAAVDDIVTLKETTSLTTKTLFETRSFQKHPRTEPSFNNERSSKRVCLCGQLHSPHLCSKFSTSEARRTEARRQKVCWKCFDRSHDSRHCSVYGPCPKCSEAHHSALLLLE